MIMYLPNENLKVHWVSCILLIIAGFVQAFVVEGVEILSEEWIPMHNSFSLSAKPDDIYQNTESDVTTAYVIKYS